MAKIRDEIVGKRFLCVSGGSSKLKLSKINEWDWRAGVIRACTHTDSKHADLQVLVEYDDVEWQRREWVHVYRGHVFQIFLLERTLAWAFRKHPAKMRSAPVPWPALVYVPLVDEAGISEHKYRPVEYLVDRVLDYHDYSEVQPYQEGEGVAWCNEEVVAAVRAWVGEQDGQRILLTTPSVLVGFRVQVYRAEGTTQWYTAVIVGYNHATRELTVTDDTVLEEHSEDPSLVQIRLIGEGVVESILRGENVGITPRRSRTATNNHHQSGVRHIRRDGVVPARARKNSLTRPNNLPPNATHTLPPATARAPSPAALALPSDITHPPSSSSTPHTSSLSSSTTVSTSSSSATKAHSLPTTATTTTTTTTSSSKSSTTSATSTTTTTTTTATSAVTPSASPLSSSSSSSGHQAATTSPVLQSSSPGQSEDAKLKSSPPPPPLLQEQQLNERKEVTNLKQSEPQDKANQRLNQQHKQLKEQKQQLPSIQLKKEHKNQQLEEKVAPQEVKEHQTSKLKENQPEQGKLPQHHHTESNSPPIKDHHQHHVKETPKKAKENKKQKVKDHHLQRIKEQNTQQLKEQQLQQVKDYQSTPIKDPLFIQSQDLSPQQTTSDQPLRQAKDPTPQQTSKNQPLRQAKDPTPQQTSRDQQLKQAKDPTHLHESKDRELKQAKDPTSQLSSDKDLQLGQAKEQLPRQIKIKLKRHIPDLLTQQIKDQLPQEVRKQLSQEVKVQLSHKVKTDLPHEPTKKALPPEIKKSSPQEETKKGFLYEAKETLSGKDKEQLPQDEKVELLCKRKEDLTPIVSSPFPLELKVQLPRKLKDELKQAEKPRSQKLIELQSQKSQKEEQKVVTQKESKANSESQGQIKKLLKQRTAQEERSDPAQQSSVKEGKRGSIEHISQEAKLKQEIKEQFENRLKEESHPLIKEQNCQKKSKRVSQEDKKTQEEDTKENSPQQDPDDNNKSGKSTTGVQRWRKRGQGSVASEASSSEEEPRPVRERHPCNHTPEPPRRILTRLEKQNSSEETTSSSSGNSTPDYRPPRRTYRNRKVKRLSNAGSLDGDSSTSNTSYSVCNTSVSDSTSSTSASSTSTSSSSTPEPELPARQKSRRVAAAAAALRHQKLRTPQPRGVKRSPPKTVTRRTPHKWRSISPGRVAKEPPAEPLRLSGTQYRNKSRTNNENNINSSNCENSVSKVSKPKADSPNRLPGKNNRTAVNSKLLEKGDSELSELSPQPQVSHVDDGAESPVINTSESEEPVVIYEKTSPHKVKVNNRRSSNDSRLSNTRRASQNSAKGLLTNKSVLPQSLQNESTGRIVKSTQSVKDPKNDKVVSVAVLKSEEQSPSSVKVFKSEERSPSVSVLKNLDKSPSSVSVLKSIEKNPSSVTVLKSEESPSVTVLKSVEKSQSSVIVLKSEEKSLSSDVLLKSEDKKSSPNTVLKSEEKSPSSVTVPVVKKEERSPSVTVLKSVEKSPSSVNVLKTTERSRPLSVIKGEEKSPPVSVSKNEEQNPSSTEELNNEDSEISIVSSESPKTSSACAPSSKANEPIVELSTLPPNKESVASCGVKSQASKENYKRYLDFSKEESPNGIVPGALITSNEVLNDEVKCSTETVIDKIVASLKDEESVTDKCEAKESSHGIPTSESNTSCTIIKSTSDSIPVCTCSCSTTSLSDSLVTTTGSLVATPSVSKDYVDIEVTSVIRTTGDNNSAVVSQHDKSVKSSVVGLSASSVVVCNSTAALCDSTSTVSTVSTVTSVTSVTSVSRVPGTTCAINSASNVSGVTWCSSSSKLNCSSTSSTTSCSSNHRGGCAEVAGVVSGRAVTITATSGPGPTCSSRVASPPSVSITAVVRSPAPLQPTNPDPAHLAPHHHEGAPHSSLHHQHQPAHPHHQQHQQLQHQSQQLNNPSSTTRMDHCDGSSDSGVSVTERSVSRSSVLSDDRSSSAEVKPNTPTPTTAGGQVKTSQASPLYLDRKEPIRVWRDPSLVSQSEHTVRHIHSVQHTSMSQHYPGVPPPHHAAPTGGSGGSHAPSHHTSHGQPPVTLPHGIPPGLPYPTHPAAAAAGVPPPLHLPPALQQPLAAAGLYPPLSHDMWKQLGPVPTLAPHAYAGLLSHHHQEEFMNLERERAERERMIKERHEAEAREKERLAKEKMERERTERERRDREERERRERERERREREEKERQQFQVEQHFNKALRLAHQKHGGDSVRQMPADHLNQAYYVHGLTNHHPSNHPTHNHSLLMTQHSKAYQAQAHAQKVAGWNPVGGLVKPDRLDAIDERRLIEQQRQEEAIRRAHEPEKMVQESIFKAFRDTDRGREPQVKLRYPPPAHSSKPPAEKPVPAALPKLAEPSFNLASYPPNFLPKEAKLPQSSERVPYSHYPDPRDKATVIVPPEVKYEKAPPHSVSPKQRPPERSSPYPPGTVYKPHDPSPSLQRSSTSQHPTSITHSGELTKARQPQSSPHSAPSPAHPDRYYAPAAKAPPTTYPSSYITAGLVPNPMHVSSVSAKPKVSSPPPHIYGKPGITTGTPVCRVDSRPSQPIPLTSKAGTGPPPAHSGRGSHSEARPTMPPHEPRPPMDRGPYDAHARIYPPTVPSPHHKHVVAPGPPVTRMPPVSSPHVATPHIPTHPSPQPTQTQPLDLGTREDTASPSKRRTQTPTPQDPKKARFETTNNQPLLSRVSEPSPLYPTAATTITTVENTVALAANLSRVASPASRPPSQPPAPTTPTLQRTENSSSPGANKTSEPEKSNSPGPAGGYVHKLKKAWLQRHESGAEIIPPTTTTTCLSTGAATPPPANITATPTKVSTTVTTTAVKSEPKPVVRKPKVVNSIPNGHSQDIKEGESSSTDSEGSTTQKPKRGKGKRKLKQMKKGSDSNSDSEKDSDASENANKNSGRLSSKQDSEPKKRGRKPKSKQEKDKEEGPKPKKSKEEPPQNDPLQKPPVSQLKKTGESFLQDGSCYEVAPKLPKCRECRWTPHQRNKKMPNIFCRFYAFRRLRYTKNGQLAVAGFSDPTKDALAEDLKLWVPDVDDPPHDLDVETSKFLLTHVGDQFCDLVEQEKEAMALHMGDDSVVAWKRVVQGVREMCDVCETTLFNIHWACSKCGFVVCIDCYKGRKNGTVKVWDDGGKDRDEYSWLLCASRLPHEQDKLMLTQIISGNALLDLGKKVHEVRHRWNIPQYCECSEAKKYKEQALQDEKKKVNGVNKDLLKNMKKETKTDLVNGTVKQEKTDKLNSKDEEMSNSPLNFFADVALSNDKRESESSDSDSDSDPEGMFSTLRELLIRPKLAKPNGSAKEKTGGSTKSSKESSKKKPKLDTVDEVISCVIEHNADKEDTKDTKEVVLKHFIRKYNFGLKGRDPLPIRIMTKTESSNLYPGVSHSWLCDGKLLRLLEPVSSSNTAIFQDMWKRGQPVIVSGVGQTLNPDLWKPASFSKDFGDVKNDLINCLTGNIVPNQPMKKFWDGFDNYSKRLKDEKGQPMVLKLKDWPPGDDFAEMLPSRFDDLMTVLPMGEYTRRNGRLNLAGRLPECFVRPDLGPKMYIAYGSATNSSKASTNLHLDISDAVNVMCYVGIPKDADYEDYMKDALKAIDEAGCDVLTRRRVREKEEVPGALWHIYHARDADKIRDLLNKVAIERGDKLEPHHDPIHDQSWYLDGPLRERLYKEYGVEGYAIIQCLGDAMFIPAGAPHQVRNLHNCIKVAEDFVSPENISYCFHLTQEFRHLSDTHTNHEDKLQIKNIIYHDMKDSLACLMSSEKDTQIKTEIKEDPEKKGEKESDS